MDAYLNLRDGGRLTWDEVNTSKSEAQLHHWHAAIGHMQDDIVSQIEANRESGLVDPVWLRKAAGKVTICRTLTRLIDRRLTALELPLPPDVSRWERRQLDEAHKRIAQLELALAKQEQAA